MRLAAPRFWWRDEPGLLARAFAPLGSVYGAVTARRMRRPGLRVDVPVLCVGNFVAGGAGKTPLAIAILQQLIERGERPAVLSRGYGRDRGGPQVMRVDLQRHTASQVGDEPLLLARTSPTYVSGDRVRAAEAALREGASVIVLDDGLQNPSLIKIAAIAVVDGVAGVGNGLCIPAGPLRARLSDQWAFVSALCLIGEGRRGQELAEEARRRHIPVLVASLEPDPQAVDALRGRKLIAFAGIGRPDKFFGTLAQCGLEVVETRSFADHHRFHPQELEELIRASQERGAELVTTEKDRVRLPSGFPARVLPVRLRLDDASGLTALLGALPR